MIEAILTDFGNVLAEVCRMATCRVLTRYTAFSAEEVCERIYSTELEIASETGRITIGAHHAAIKEALEMERELSIETFRAAFWEGLSLIPGSINVFLRVKQAGFPVYVLSNISEVHKEWFLDSPELLKVSDRNIFSCDTGFMKPDPEAFDVARRQLGLKPDQTLFLDDRLQNCVAAERAGFQSVQINEPTKDVPRLAQQILSSYSLAGVSTKRK